MTVTVFNKTNFIRTFVSNNLILLFSLALPFLTSGQGSKKAPTGKEIASEAKNYRLLNQGKKTEVINGKKISITPAEIIDSTQSKDGQFLGVLENEIAGVETGLPPGRYNLFITYVDKKPHVYAESNGSIVKEALRVSVERLKDKPNPKDQIVIKSKGLSSSVFFQYGWTTSIYSHSSYLYSITGGSSTSGSGYNCLICYMAFMHW